MEKFYNGTKILSMNDINGNKPELYINNLKKIQQKKQHCCCFKIQMAPVVTGCETTYMPSVAKNNISHI